MSSSAPVTSYFLKQAPSPVGAYVHARTAGGLLFLAGARALLFLQAKHLLSHFYLFRSLEFLLGVGPRAPGTNAIPGGPIRDPTTGAPLVYKFNYDFLSLWYIRRRIMTSKPKPELVLKTSRLYWKEVALRWTRSAIYAPLLLLKLYLGDH